MVSLIKGMLSKILEHQIFIKRLSIKDSIWERLRSARLPLESAQLAKSPAPSITFSHHSRKAFLLSCSLTVVHFQHRSEGWMGWGAKRKAKWLREHIEERKIHSYYATPNPKKKKNLKDFCSGRHVYMNICGTGRQEWGKSLFSPASSIKCQLFLLLLSFFPRAPNMPSSTSFSMKRIFSAYSREKNKNNHVAQKEKNAINCTFKPAKLWAIESVHRLGFLRRAKIVHLTRCQTGKRLAFLLFLASYNEASSMCMAHPIWSRDGLHFLQPLTTRRNICAAVVGEEGKEEEEGSGL